MWHKLQKWKMQERSMWHKIARVESVMLVLIYMQEMLCDVCMCIFQYRRRRLHERSTHQTL